MSFVVLFVSLCVQIYSLNYMSDDPYLPKFMSYLSLFTFFMLVLVTSNNLIQIFLGWEGVGLVSFLLVNFWHTRIQAVKSAIKAILVNKVGDIFLIFSMVFIQVYFGTLDFDHINLFIDLVYFSKFLGINILELISFFLIVAAAGKSAQLFLHTWLPDAMEGPTPVSALIHAATMVTAGVFLLLRFSLLIEVTYYSKLLLIVLGSLTSVFGASVALFQNDIKRIIAYSTCSQLGYMVFSIGLSNYNLAFFHLFNHAFFKALLFLSAGVVIHALAGEQDIRKMGGLVRLLPFTYVCILVSSLSLMGFPFLTGFYSKDIILSTSFFIGTYYGYYSFFMGLLAAIFTAAYSAKLLYLTFLMTPNGFRENYKLVHEGPFFMTLAQMFLFIGTVFFGYLMNDAMIGVCTDFWNNCFFKFPNNELNIFYSETLNSNIKLLPVYFSLLSFYLTFCFYIYSYLQRSSFSYHLGWLDYYNFFSKRWYFDIVYNSLIVKPFIIFGYQVAYVILDRGFIEWFGPFGLVKFIAKLSNMVSFVHSGHLYHYLSWFLFSLFFLTYFYFVIWLNLFDLVAGGNIFFIIFFWFLLLKS